MATPRQSTQNSEHASRYLLDLVSEGLIVADSRGRIEFANRAFREACGCQPEGLMLSELVDAAVRSQIKTSLERYVASTERSTQLKLQLATSTNALELSLERRDDNERLYGRAPIVTHHTALDAPESAVGTLLERKLRVLNESERFLFAVSELDSARFLDVNRALSAFTASVRRMRSARRPSSSGCSARRIKRSTLRCCMKKARASSTH